jgi:hypothetical protein
MELKSFTFGIIFGMAILIGGAVAASLTQGIRWEPVKINGRHSR